MSRHFTYHSNVCASAVQTSGPGGRSSLTYATLTAGKPVATTTLKAGTASRHRFSPSAVKRVAMHSPTPVTSIARLEARCCHGTCSLHTSRIQVLAEKWRRQFRSLNVKPLQAGRQETTALLKEMQVCFAYKRSGCFSQRKCLKQDLAAQIALPLL